LIFLSEVKIAKYIWLEKPVNKKSVIINDINKIEIKKLTKGPNEFEVNAILSFYNDSDCSSLIMKNDFIFALEITCYPREITLNNQNLQDSSALVVNSTRSLRIQDGEIIEWTYGNNNVAIINPKSYFSVIIKYDVSSSQMINDIFNKSNVDSVSSFVYPIQNAFQILAENLTCYKKIYSQHIKRDSNSIVLTYTGPNISIPLDK
jgi:hypothetical protein